LGRSCQYRNTMRHHAAYDRRLQEQMQTDGRKKCDTREDAYCTPRKPSLSTSP
jgi:hypothetical protein